MSVPSKYYHDQLQGYPTVDEGPNGNESTDVSRKTHESGQGSTLSVVLVLSIAISMLGLGLTLGGFMARSMSNPVIAQLQDELRSRPVIYVDRQVKDPQSVPPAPKPGPTPSSTSRPIEMPPAAVPTMTPPPAPYQTTPPIPTVLPNAVNEGCEPDTGVGC